jgi:hypothetical protein
MRSGQARKDRLELQKSEELILKQMKANFFELKFRRNNLLAFGAAMARSVILFSQGRLAGGN